MPNLLTVIDSLDKVAEPLRAFYEAKDGKYVLMLDGTPHGFASASDLALANGKVVEFRENNIKLTKEVEELRPRVKLFEGIDPTKAKDALAKVDELEKKGVKGTEDVTKLVTDGITAALGPIKTQLEQSQARELAASKRADEALLKTTIGDAFTKAGGLPKARDYIVDKAKEAFEVKDGKVVALPTKFSTTSPGNPLGIDEWLTGAAREHDFAFTPSGGGGAAGGGGNAGAGGRVLKPGQTVLKNPTPAELGAAAADIKAGKVVVEHTEATV